MVEKCCSPNECCGGFKLGNMLPTNTIEEVDNAIEITQNEISLNEKKCTELYRNLAEYRKIRGDMEFIKIANKGLVDKCFYADNGALLNTIFQKEDKIIVYFRIIEIISRNSSEGIYAKIELFNKIEYNDGEVQFEIMNKSRFLYFSDIQPEKEVEKDIFYQKRDEFFNEYKAYLAHESN